MTFRGTCMNPSCDAPGCHARAENPGAGGKDYCLKHKPTTPDRPSRAEFFARVDQRLANGERVYGDASFERPTTELLGEIEEELLDIAGWSYVAWCRLVALKKRVEAASPTDERAVKETA